jgi:hypothetical protein
LAFWVNSKDLRRGQWALIYTRIVEASRNVE